METMELERALLERDLKILNERIKANRLIMEKERGSSSLADLSISD